MKPNHCIDCGKNLADYRSKRCMSCAMKYRLKNGLAKIISKNRKGKHNSPKTEFKKGHEAKKGKANSNYIDGRTKQKHYCIDCGKEIHYTTWLYGRKNCKSCATKGSNNPSFIDGNGYYPYPKKFNRNYKRKMRERDNHQCQICGKSTKKNGRALDVHHIDYDKESLNPDNLISLCRSCHGKTNFNREVYIEYFRILRGILCN